jgi:ABC-2 type transport system ATP-binding protein
MILIQSASKQYHQTIAIDRVSVSLASGKSYALLGANGAGKSTLLQLIAGWLPLTSGRIAFDESPMRPAAIHVRKRCYLLDTDGLLRIRSDRKPLLDIFQDLEDYGVTKDSLDAEIAMWFNKLEITSLYWQPVRAMSKGQAYKFGMVSLFVLNRDLWLLDEPFSPGLDAAGLEILESQMKQHATAGGTVIFTSQWPEHAKRLADHAIVLDAGKLVWSAPPQQQVAPNLLQSANDGLAAVLRGLG